MWGSAIFFFFRLSRSRHARKDGNRSPELLFPLKVSVWRLSFTFHAAIMDPRKMQIVLFDSAKTLAGLTYRRIGGQV
jgi:hypothetical protein